jgi:hypothetical protein
VKLIMSTRGSLTSAAPVSGPPGRTWNGHRRLHIGLQDHGVAHCEGGADHPRTEDERRVPRCDDADDAHRNPPSDALTPGFQVGGQDPLRVAAECRRFQELAGRHLDLPLCLCPDRTRLSDDLIGDLIGASEQQAGEFPQHVATLRARHLGPALLCLTRHGGRR